MRSWLTKVWIAVAVLYPTAIAFAQDGTDPETSRGQAFVPVEGPQVEDVPGGPLMIGAYSVLWLLVFGYLWMVATRARNIERRIVRLEAASKD